MGQPKLLLPLDDSTIAEQVIQAWLQSRVDQVIAVVRRADTELASRCSAAGAAVVLPSVDPAEMRYSVEEGLAFARSEYKLGPGDAWFLAPADMPRISVRLINRLLDAFLAEGPAIYVPSCAGRRGHPVVLPGALAAEVSNLGEDEGLNSLVKQNPVTEIPWDDSAEWADIDTPEEYEGVRGRKKARRCEGGKVRKGL